VLPLHVGASGLEVSMMCLVEVMDQNLLQSRMDDAEVWSSLVAEVPIHTERTEATGGSDMLRAGGILQVERMMDRSVC